MTICKFRGITLNYTASQLVNIESTRDGIFNEERNITIHTEMKIKRKKRRNGGGDGVSVIKEPEDKIYIISFH
jgi:hypothetical protein